MTLLLWAVQGWTAKLRRHGIVVAGRRIHLMRRERTALRRAGSWFGIGPARSGASGIPAPMEGATVAQVDITAWSPDGETWIDFPPGRPHPDDDLVGIAVHAGRWLWLLTWLPVRRPT